MARTSLSGFEVGTLIGEPGDSAATGSGMSVDTSVFRSGLSSVKATAVSGVNGTWVGLNNLSTYNRLYMKVTSFPSTTARILTGSGSSVNLKLNPNGSIAYYNGASLIGTSAAVLIDTMWHRVEWRKGTATAVPVLLIDGITEVTGSPSGWTYTSNIGPNDTVADTYTVNFDDYASDNADWPGPGRVVLLRPISDNNVGGWKRGGGSTTTNLWIPVSISPPPGVASANETDNTNIESATNSASDDCDLNCASYLSMGININDIVKGMIAVVRNGEDAGTNTKAGAISIVSNPVQVGEDAFTFGFDLGAHGLEAGFWNTSAGTVQTPTSVVVGTSPVLRVGKRTATTRVVCVDFMGIYVDYTPMGEKSVQLNQAVNRAAVW